MSAAQHEQEARDIEASAATHSGQRDAEASRTIRTCSTTAPVYGAEAGLPICWTSVVNPTAADREEAEQYRALAARHREASAELRAAEARACVGISPADRDTSPFLRRGDIAQVERLAVNPGRSAGRAYPEILKGARVTVRAVPGLTAEWLQRVVDCHVARNATLGHSAAEMRDCPLATSSVSARVTSTGSGFMVDISSEDPDVAKEILGRAERLVSQGAPK